MRTNSTRLAFGPDSTIRNGEPSFVKLAKRIEVGQTSPGFLKGSK
jgi:hypothetical protein